MRVLLIVLLAAPFCVNAQEKIYKIGDYYNVNSVEGVVFYITDGGRHGKIVSLDEAPKGAYWTTLYDNEETEASVTGATSTTDGRKNTEIVSRLVTYTPAAFPAFAYCIAKGRGWYLPAIDELKDIVSARAQDDLDTAIVKVGGGRFHEYYWSSTEEISPAQKADPDCRNCKDKPRRSPGALAIDLNDGQSFYYRKTDATYSARAVHQF